MNEQADKVAQEEAEIEAAKYDDGKVVMVALILLIVAGRETTATGHDLAMVRTMSSVLNMTNLRTLVRSVEEAGYLETTRLPRCLAKDYPSNDHPYLRKYSPEVYEAAVLLANTWLD